jgi:hypothetical protein
MNGRAGRSRLVYKCGLAFSTPATIAPHHRAIVEGLEVSAVCPKDLKFPPEGFAHPCTDTPSLLLNTRED